MSNIKGKIDKNGCLLIERANGVYKHQLCPYNENYCRDNCPLFEEPEYYDNAKKTHIDICHGKFLVFDQLIDERKDLNNYEIDLQADLIQEICKRYWDLQERIEVIENIAKVITDNPGFDIEYGKEAQQFAKYVLQITKDTKEILENLEGDVIEFDESPERNY